jgi:DNA-binding NtrC family response regulator
VKVLIVEDDKASRKGLEETVRELGGDALAAGTVADARAALESFGPDFLFVDIHLPDGDGIELLRAWRAEDPAREGVVITGQSSIDSAIEALRAGAFDYLLKPVRAAQIEVLLQRLGEKRRLVAEVETLRTELQETGRLGHLVGRSPAMQELFDVLRKVSKTEASVLITGASGSGKEVVARTLHELSRRASRAFVAFNCGAISPTLIESELFGHERGAFTGADRRRIGYFEEANGGTLFLDEITEMSAELQVKLLRVLEDRTLRRIGGAQEMKVDVRLISATNREPERAIADGKLREDLFYRLNVFPIRVPTLAEHAEDVPLLAEHFRRQIEAQEKAGVSQWEDGALEMLQGHAWPGNVRELRNVVHRAYILSDGDTIRVATIENLLSGASTSPSAPASRTATPTPAKAKPRPRSTPAKRRAR